MTDPHSRARRGGGGVRAAGDGPWCRLGHLSANAAAISCATGKLSGQQRRQTRPAAFAAGALAGVGVSVVTAFHLDQLAPFGTGDAVAHPVVLLALALLPLLLLVPIHRLDPSGRR
jgi:hypothetical protein